MATKDLLQPLCNHAGPNITVKDHLREKGEKTSTFANVGLDDSWLCIPGSSVAVVLAGYEG